MQIVIMLSVIKNVIMLNVVALLGIETIYSLVKIFLSALQH
jgi:hypothetical protein